MKKHGATKIKYLNLALIMILPASTLGQVYKTTNEEGQVIFSDRPQSQSQRIDIQPVNIADEIDLPEVVEEIDPEPSENPNQQALPYEIDILSPSNGAEIGSSQHDVVVEIDIYPELLRGHGVQVYWNGYPETELGRSTTVVLENVSRRTAPELRAVIKDEQGQVLAMSSPVIIHIKPRFLVAPVRPVTPRPIPRPAPPM